MKGFKNRVGKAYKRSASFISNGSGARRSAANSIASSVASATSAENSRAPSPVIPSYFPTGRGYSPISDIIIPPTGSTTVKKQSSDAKGKNKQNGFGSDTDTDEDDGPLLPLPSRWPDHILRNLSDSKENENSPLLNSNAGPSNSSPGRNFLAVPARQAAKSRKRSRSLPSVSRDVDSDDEGSLDQFQDLTDIFDTKPCGRCRRKLKNLQGDLAHHTPFSRFIHDFLFFCMPVIFWRRCKRWLLIETSGVPFPRPVSTIYASTALLSASVLVASSSFLNLPHLSETSKVFSVVTVALCLLVFISMIFSSFYWDVFLIRKTRQKIYEILVRSEYMTAWEINDVEEEEPSYDKISGNVYFHVPMYVLSVPLVLLLWSIISLAAAYIAHARIAGVIIDPPHCTLFAQYVGWGLAVMVGFCFGILYNSLFTS